MLKKRKLKDKMRSTNTGISANSNGITAGLKRKKEMGYT